MTERKILIYPESKKELRMKSEPVESVSSGVKKIITDLKDTLKEHEESGHSFDEVFQGFNAVIVHHEIDHLEGVLLIDRIESPEDLYRMHKKPGSEIVKVPIGVKINPL